MKLYSLYSMDVITPEREALQTRHPKAAEYLPFYLFCETHEQAFGVPASNILDLSRHRLVNTEAEKESEDDMTFDEFRTLADRLLQQEHTGREVILNKQQGPFLKQEFYSEQVVI